MAHQILQRFRVHTCPRLNAAVCMAAYVGRDVRHGNTTFPNKNPSILERMSGCVYIFLLALIVIQDYPGICSSFYAYQTEPSRLLPAGSYYMYAYWMTAGSSLDHLSVKQSSAKSVLFRELRYLGFACP